MRLKLTWIVMTLGLSFVSAPAHAVNCGAVTVLNNLKTFAGEFRNFSGTYRVELVQMPDWRTVSCDALFGGGTSFKAAQLCTFRVTDTRTGRVTQTAPVTEVYMRASANTSYFTFDVPSRRELEVSAGPHEHRLERLLPRRSRSRSQRRRQPRPGLRSQGNPLVIANDV